MFPAEYDRVSEVYESEEAYVHDEVANQKPLCYYVMNNNFVEEKQAIFERPDPGMMYHLKPLFIREKVDDMAINKVFIDGGATVNMMPHSLSKKMVKTNEDLRPHNMVLSKYDNKTRHNLSVMQVELSVGSIIRPTLFMVITSNANYKLLLGREQIQGIGVMPSTLH